MTAIDIADLSELRNAEGLPRTVRLPDALWEGVDLLAAQMGGTPRDAIEVLLGAGLIGRELRQARGEAVAA